jgi:hypothetical protein
MVELLQEQRGRPPRGKVGRVLETPRENGKPIVPRLVFDGRKGVESHKRDLKNI